MADFLQRGLLGRSCTLSLLPMYCILSGDSFLHIANLLCYASSFAYFIICLLARLFLNRYIQLNIRLKRYSKLVVCCSTWQRTNTTLNMWSISLRSDDRALVLLAASTLCLFELFIFIFILEPYGVSERKLQPVFSSFS